MKGGTSTSYVEECQGTHLKLLGGGRFCYRSIRLDKINKKAPCVTSPGSISQSPEPKRWVLMGEKKKKKHIMSKLENSLSLEFVTFRPELGLEWG